MTPEEADDVIAKMAGSWRQELTPVESGEWHDTLAAYDRDMAIRTVAELRLVTDWFPTHKQFTEAIVELARRVDASRTLAGPPEDPPEKCGLCDGNGWRQVDVYGRHLTAVERCRCSKGRKLDCGLDDGYEHPRGCNCHVCRYGRRRAHEMARAERGHPLVKVLDVPSEQRLPVDEERF